MPLLLFSALQFKCNLILQKPGDEQEVVSLADGTVVSVAAYKNMLADPKSRAALQK